MKKKICYVVQTRDEWRTKPRWHTIGTYPDEASARSFATQERDMYRGVSTRILRRVIRDKVCARFEAQP